MTLGGIVGLLLLKPALIVAMASLLALACRRQPAVVRHAIWSGALAAAILLPILSSVLPEIRVATLAPVLPAVAVPPVPQPQAVPTALATQVESPASISPSATTGQTVLNAVLVIWLLGMLIKATRRLNAEARLRAMLVSGAPASRQLELSFARAAKEAGLRRPVTLRLSAAIASPAALGVFKPAILLPIESERWSARNLHAAFGHELGHLVRRDPVFNLLGFLASLVYWPNPAIAYAVRQLRTESERACDDRVLNSGASPGRYARFLVRLAATESRKRDATYPALAMARVGELEKRLVAVLDDRVRRRPPPERRVRTLAGAALALALPVATLTPVPRLLGPHGPEPDRQADALANPVSERVPIDYAGFRVPSSARGAEQGPDSLLVRTLVAGLDHVPQNEADLIRERSYWALTRIENGRLIDPLLVALQDPDWRVQSYAAWTLALVRTPRAVAPLEQLVAHPVWRLRAMAAAALRAMGDSHSIDAMTRALNDPAWQVRSEAVEYLGATLPPESRIELLTPRLNDRHIAVRQAAEQALSH